MPLNLIHHLMRFNVFKHSPEVRLTIIAETEDALHELAHQQKAVLAVLFVVSQCGHQLYQRLS